MANKLYKKYDPQNMTLDEYGRFIDDLINGGILNRAEADGMGVGNRVIVGTTATIQEIRSPLDNISSLGDANGNVKLFLSALQERDWGSLRENEAHAGAARKALAILDAMLERREQEKRKV